MSNTILYRTQGHIAYLTLNNPERHNSLGAAELEGIQASLSQVNADENLRVLVVTGSGEKTFCAGASLQQLNAGEISSDFFQDTTDQLASLKIPTICAINGNVFGGGVELALSCDFRVGIEGSRMRVPAAAIGLCYPLSGINRYVERLGVNAAKRILVAAEVFSAAEMHRIGFLDHLVSRDEIANKAWELAEGLAALAPLSVKAMKHILAQAASGSVDLIQAELLADQCSQSQDLQEGFLAQAEKRTPQFTGR
ncbi:MAG: enoyl-CoA hydratase/carnithine racemase [Alcanivorax sp.]|jgi:enoyl-CoA hydratase/carnithine racemase